MGKDMVRMQIEPLSAFDEDAARLLSLCVRDGKRELKEYLENPAAELFCVKKERVCAILILIFGGDTADIADIAVCGNMRRQGVGTALLSYAADLCKSRGISRLMLEVRASNKAAISLYERAGFEKIATRRRYYSNPAEDAAVFWRNL